MSGEPEIEQWTVENIDLRQFITVDEAFDAISLQFESDNRLPLDQILQEEKPKFLRFLTPFIVSPRFIPKTPKEVRVQTFLEEEQFIADRITRAMEALFG